MVLIRKKIKKSPEEIEADRKEKELRKSGIQDEFQAKGFELVTWAQHHKSRITIIICAITAAMVLWGGISYFRGGALISASTDYESALNIFERAATAQADKKDLQAKALKAFENIAQQHSETGIAKFAQLHVGVLSLSLNDAKGAVLAYDRVVKMTSNDDPLHQVAMLGLAASYEAASEPKKALESYESMLNSNVKIDEAMLLWQAHRLAKVAGLDKKADEFAVKLAEEFVGSRYADQTQILPKK